MNINILILKKIQEYKNDIIDFLIDMVNIHSITCNEKKIALRIKQEMDKIEFDETFIDGMGNVIGRIGNGDKIIAIDAHIDTVGIGDDELWNQNPFRAKIKDDIIYGRGILEQKGAIASIVYSSKMIKELELIGEYTLYVIGSIMKEEYDGGAWKYIIENDKIKPDFVIITEPTNLNISIGGRGRMEMEISIGGLSTDSGDCIRGLNSIYRSMPIIRNIETLNTLYKSNSFGKASISINDIIIKSPSKACVPDKCIINIDRRITMGEKIEDILKEIKCIIPNNEVKIKESNKTTYTGYKYTSNNVLMPWTNNKDSFLLKKTIEVYEMMYGKKPQITNWMITTNGSVTSGIFNIPTIGFGPGKEILAYGPREQVAIDDLIKSCKLYTILPLKLSEFTNKKTAD